MKVQVVSQTGVGATHPIMVNTNITPCNIGFSVTVSGTVTANVVNANTFNGVLIGNTVSTKANVGTLYTTIISTGANTATGNITGTWTLTSGSSL